MRGLTPAAAQIRHPSSRMELLLTVALSDVLLFLVRKVTSVSRHLQASLVTKREGGDTPL